jgi:hypothetical protein
MNEWMGQTIKRTESLKANLSFELSIIKYSMCQMVQPGEVQNESLIDPQTLDAGICNEQR